MLKTAQATREIIVCIAKLSKVEVIYSGKAGLCESSMHGRLYGQNSVMVVSSVYSVLVLLTTRRPKATNHSGFRQVTSYFFLFCPSGVDFE